MGNLNVPNGWSVDNEKPQTGQLSRTRMWNGNKWYWCPKETGGKCEGRWVRHTPNSCEGKAFKVFKKRGMLKEAPKPYSVEKKARDRKKMMMRKEGNTRDLPPPSLLRKMRLTTSPILVIIMNEKGGGKVIG